MELTDINNFSLSGMHSSLRTLIDGGIDLGLRIAAAIVIYIIGRILINWINRIIASILVKRKIEPSIQTFLRSTVDILLMILLGLAIIGKLGINITGFAALLASAGVAIGMALSGNLQNVAGGILILVFRPYKVGDYIDSSTGTSGTVKEIQLFHTVLNTPDNKMVYVPNGSLSNSVVTNYSHQETRRVEWNIGIEYGDDFDKVKQVLLQIIAEEPRILKEPAPFIEIGELAESSVNVKIRVWVESNDYWDVYFHMNQLIYTTFNKEGISFPFPQLTIHQV